tara:strand:+ start:5443 stop:5727 length:285 start_codon:yes stop_codon:yes gene_type:complete
MEKIKTKHGEFDIKPLSFKDRRTLHRMEINAANIDGEKMDYGAYVEMIDWVLNKSLINTEMVLKDFDDNQIDEIGSEIYAYIKNSNKKKTKKSE